MRRDIGDILDRWSIAKLKSERNPHPDSLKEYLVFEKELKRQEKKQLFNFISLRECADYLYKINGFIWDLEADLRQCKIDGDLKEVGRRAILIRNFNSLRVGFKNIINKIYGDGFQDIKFQHLSGNL
jgi:hypothetical protein